MSFDWKSLLTKENASLAVMGVILLLCMKNCGDGNKSRDADERVQNIEVGIANLQKTADSTFVVAQENNAVVKENNAVVKENNVLAHRIDNNLDTVKEDVRYIKDSCCNCGKDKPRLKVRTVDPKPKTPAPRDTVYKTVVVHDTVYKPVVRDTVPQEKKVVRLYTGGLIGNPCR